MNVYRIAKTPYINDLSENGAKIYGGRWNEKGTSLIYTFESRAPATLEYLVHLPPSIMPIDVCLMTLQISDEIAPREILISNLPDNWRDYPAPSASLNWEPIGL